MNKPIYERRAHPRIEHNNCARCGEPRMVHFDGRCPVGRGVFEAKLPAPSIAERGSRCES